MALIALLLERGDAGGVSFSFRKVDFFGKNARKKEKRTSSERGKGQDMENGWRIG